MNLRMERLFTRPSQISGKPVTSLTLVTGNPASFNNFIVPLVERISQPSDTNASANATTPALSLTLINARMLF